MPSVSKKQHNLMALVANDPKAAKRLGIPQKVGEEFMKADKGRKFGSGGPMKESKAMMKKEVAFMKKKGAPKSMIRHEEKEMGMKKSIKKMSGGAYIGPPQNLPSDLQRYYDRSRRGITPSGRQVLPSSHQQTMNAMQRIFEQGLNQGSKTSGGLRGGKLGAALAGAGALGAAAKGLYDQFTMPEDNSQMSPEPETGALERRRGGKVHSRMKAPKKHRYASGGVTYSGGGSVYRSKADGIASKGKTKGKMVKMRYGGEC